MTFAAVIFDLGGVVFPSPFEAFDAYNRQAGLPEGFVRSVVRESSERGAWAALERGELTASEFHGALEAEAAAAGHPIDAAALMAGVTAGFGPRPEMVRAVETIRAHDLRTAALTNNWHGPATETEPVPEVGHRDATGGVGALFDVVVESAREGIRKPDPRIYERTVARLGVTGVECVYLDDLGINCKPARALGMTTIKVVDPTDALAELGRVLGIDLRVEAGTGARPDGGSSSSGGN